MSAVRILKSYHSIIDVCRHEAGHYVLSQILGFENHEININVKFGGNSGHNKIKVFDPDNIEDKINFNKQRIKVLFAGILSEQSKKSIKERLKETGKSDYEDINIRLNKIIELQHSEITDNSRLNELRQKLEQELFEQTEELVKKNQKWINIIANYIEPKVICHDKDYIFTDEEIKKISLLKELFRDKE